MLISRNELLRKQAWLLPSLFGSLLSYGISHQCMCSWHCGVHSPWSNSAKIVRSFLGKRAEHSSVWDHLDTVYQKGLRWHDQVLEIIENFSNNIKAVGSVEKLRCEVNALLRFFKVAFRVKEMGCSTNARQTTWSIKYTGQVLFKAPNILSPLLWATLHCLLLVSCLKHVYLKIQS